MSMPIDGLSHIYAKAHPTPSISIAMVAASLIQMPRPQAPHVKSRGLAAPDRSADLPPGVHDLIVKHHAAVAGLFGSGAGHFLQFVESQIMVKALLHMRSLDIVGLPIHDCLITREKDVDFAKTAMELASRQVVGHTLAVEVKASGEGPEGVEESEEELEEVGV